MTTDSLDPLRLLQDDLKDDDYEQTIQSINRLSTIASAMGPVRTRNELLPFLLEYGEQDNDEAQTAIARQLGDFVDLVGGPVHGVSLIPILEKLAGEEELVVRDAAVQSLVKILPQLPRADVATKIIPTLRKLANGEWFTTRVSACGLFSSTYTLVAEQLQADLRVAFVHLCNDDTPMVRKAAFHNLGNFANAIQKQYFKSDLYPIVKALASDDLDVMRIYTIDCCADLGKKLDSAEYVQLLLPLIEGLQDDNSWRVRQQLSKSMPKLCEGVDNDVGSKRLLPVFAKLLKDKEAEVRVSSAKSLPGVCGAVKLGLLDHIAPTLEALATDQVQNVRVAFSSSLVELCPHFGKETAAKLLVPLIQQMARDEFHQVRNNIINKMDVLAETADKEKKEKDDSENVLLNSVLPNILELAKDPKWRVRKTVVDKMGLMAKSLGIKTFEKKLQSVVLTSLSDHVFAIRERACAQIGTIVQEFGGKWAADKFFQSCFTIYDKTTNYLHRMTCLLIIQNCASKCSSDVIDKSLLPLVMTAATDDVANVRIAACKTLKEIIPQMEKSITKSKIEPALQKLVKDADTDVAYFASVALKEVPSN